MSSGISFCVCGKAYPTGREHLCAGLTKVPLPQLIKPPCGHTKYEGSIPCLCNQFETYWREKIAKEIEGWHESSASYHKDFDHCDCLKILAIARGQK